MWCSYIHDAGFANPQIHAHARRLYTRRDGLRSPPGKLNNWCCARLPLLRKRHLPLLFAASMADEPTRDRHSHTRWSRLVSCPGPNLTLGRSVRIAVPMSPAKLWRRSRRVQGYRWTHRGLEQKPRPADAIGNALPGGIASVCKKKFRWARDHDNYIFVAKEALGYGADFCYVPAWFRYGCPLVSVAACWLVSVTFSCFVPLVPVSYFIQKNVF